MPVAVIPALAAAVLGEEALRLAIQPVMAEIGVQLSYAMGWVADNFRGDRGKEAAALATLHAAIDEAKGQAAAAQRQSAADASARTLAEQKVAEYEALKKLEAMVAAKKAAEPQWHSMFGEDDRWGDGTSKRS
jgi:hypothetical protein